MWQFRPEGVYHYRSLPLREWRRPSPPYVHSAGRRKVSPVRPSDGRLSLLRSDGERIDLGCARWQRIHPPATAAILRPEKLSALGSTIEPRRVQRVDGEGEYGAARHR